MPLALGLKPNRRTAYAARQRKRVRLPLALVLGFSTLVVLGLGQAVRADTPQAQETSAGPTAARPSAPPPAAPIAVERIAPAAAEAAQLLRRFSADLVPGPKVEEIRAALPGLDVDLTRDLKRSLAVLAGQPSLEALQDQEQLWYYRQIGLGAWLETLTEDASRLQGALTQLEGLKRTWTLTRTAATADGDPPSVLDQIDSTLTGIESAVPAYRNRRDDLLDLQGGVARQVARCETARTRIVQAQRGAVGTIFERNSVPLWSPELWRAGLVAIPGRLGQIAEEYRGEIRAYLRIPANGLPLHLGVFVALLVALRAAARQVSDWAEQGDEVARMAAVSRHPLASAALVALTVATTIMAPTPLGIKAVLSALALLPLVVLVRPHLGPEARPVLYTLGALFALDTARHAFGGIPPLVGQFALFVESLAGVVALLWLLAHRRSRPETPVVGGTTPSPTIQQAKRWLAAAALVTMAVGLLASLLGALRIARLTTPAILIGGTDAVWLFAAVEVLTAALAYLFRVWPLRRLHLVRNHRERLLTKARRWLILVAAVAWAARYLSYLGLFDTVWSAIVTTLQARLTLGTFSTSGSAILAFGLTLWIAWLLSAAMRSVLEEDIYPRAGIGAGISYAASSVLHYSIAIVAFVVALGFLGITLTQVTVFAGALGVGVGLGLQGVVHNFVSGLILLFEQPIHVGDAVQVGDLQGRVRRIGIRASVVRTLQGAEVIIPNSQLTANQVTNWTLSDEQSRIDLPVGLAYGTDPAKAIELLERVAVAHPKVLLDPMPRCLFKGYGDSSIDFELRVWVEYGDRVEVQSDLTTAIYNAVYAAGMSFPFPQREVRLLADPVPAKVPADGSGASA